MNASKIVVLILDYGSQYTQLITRRIRELGFYSQILPAHTSLEMIKRISPKSIILSGGPASVYDPLAPQLPQGLMSYQAEQKIPLLGICYGMQLLVQSLGGKVKPAKLREYGRVQVQPQSMSRHSQLLEGHSFCAWMSHGDEVQDLPPGFIKTAESELGAFAVIENASTKVYALQFHPEVTHTEGGKEILRKFLVNITGLQPNWNLHSALESKIQNIKAQVEPEEHVICALSGGVDSSVAAILVNQAVGNRLHCFFVDHGLLRLHERKRVMELFEKKFHLPVICLDESEVFLKKLEGVSDPEKKRKIIGAEFVYSFERAAKSIAEKVGHLPKYLVQGTLYPDVIESSAGSSHSMTIKTHHNVGGLPDQLNFQLIEPFRDLFKDEVRELGRELGVPREFLNRHPFPGPGLAIRIIGEVTQEKLRILREVDEIFIQSILKAGLYEDIWQAFAVFLPLKSVGVQGDGRTHDYVVALRAVNSIDGMTADWYSFDRKFLAEVSNRICNEVKGVNRVVYDISSKPPATIEWE